MNLLIFFNYEYGFSLLFLNVFIYVIILLNIFSILFLFNFKFFKTLSDFKNLKSITFVNFSFILILLSMSGMPPMLGFTGKFLIFIFFMIKQSFFISFLFTILNFFLLYFYLQNIRFLVSKNNTIYYIFKNNFVYFNFNYIYIIVFLNFFNFFGIVFIEDIIIFFIYIGLFFFV